MAVSEREIRKVALLARLELTPEETRMMASQLSRVLEYMERLAGANTEGVEPLAHAVEVTNVLREDRVVPGLDRESALANAPHRDEECYRVPAVLGET